MAGDLVSSKYPLGNAWQTLLNGLSNSVQGNSPVRSNAEWGIGNWTDGAMASTGVLVAVPVPVDVGQVISGISFLVGATGASTPTHQFGALYAGTGAAPALLAQSTDTTTAVIAASSGWVTYKLATPQIITTTNAPAGFVYAGVSITASTIPTALSCATPSGINYQWVATTGALFLSMTAGSALAGTAATTIASPSAKAVAPILALT